MIGNRKEGVRKDERDSKQGSKGSLLLTHLDNFLTDTSGTEF